MSKPKLTKKQMIAEIQAGTHVIKNDILGDKRVLDVLNECEIDRNSKWSGIHNTNDIFYGIDDDGDFYWLTKSEIKDRPHFLMSELVEVESEHKCETGCRAYTGGEIRHHEDCFHYPQSFTKMYDDLKRKLSLLQPTEPKEVFTVEEIQKLFSAQATVENAKAIATNFNRMSFNAYTK